MGKLKCICGNILSDTCHPDINQGLLISSWDDENHNFENNYEVMECDKCGALAIEYPKNSPEVKWYIPFDGKCLNLFKKE